MTDHDSRSGSGRRAGKERRSSLDTRPEKQRELNGERRSGHDRRLVANRRLSPDAAQVVIDVQEAIDAPVESDEAAWIRDLTNSES
jgi:hypothetical protein